MFIVALSPAQQRKHHHINHHGHHYSTLFERLWRPRQESVMNLAGHQYLRKTTPFR